MPDLKATHQQTKLRNRDLVLKLIFNSQTISRAEIARITKLTRATVSDMVALLISEGLVEEIGFGESLGGKAPILLSLAPDSRYLIGLNLAQDRFVGSVVNLRGEIKEEVEFPVNGSDGQEAIQRVYQILDQLLAKQWRPLMGIGIGTPGLVNTQDGVVVDAVNLDWKELPLARMLESKYGLPVTVLNDSQATAIGEYVYGGHGSQASNLIVITARHGIGAGIMIDGRLFQGDGGGAGEIGHVVVCENGLRCRCGKYGCLETVASARAVLQRAAALAPEYPQSRLNQDLAGITLDTLADAWQAEDPLAVRVLGEAARYLGISIASLIGVLNIHKIVLIGEMARFGERWLGAVREAMSEYALNPMARGTRLQTSSQEHNACILGAAAYMLLESYSLLFTRPPD